MKSWLAQGSSGRQVTLPPRTTVLLITLYKQSFRKKKTITTHMHTHIWLCGIKFINERSFNLSKFSVYFFFWYCLGPDPSYTSISTDSRCWSLPFFSHFTGTTGISLTRTTDTFETVNGQLGSTLFSKKYLKMEMWVLCIQ